MTSNYKNNIIRIAAMDIAVAESVINAIKGRKKYNRAINIAISPMNSDKLYRLDGDFDKAAIYNITEKKNTYISIDEMANIMKDVMYNNKNKDVYINISA